MLDFGFWMLGADGDRKGVKKKLKWLQNGTQIVLRIHINLSFPAIFCLWMEFYGSFSSFNLIR
jgi:hypothetical protein